MDEETSKNRTPKDKTKQGVKDDSGINCDEVPTDEEAEKDKDEDEQVEKERESASLPIAAVVRKTKVKVATNERQQINKMQPVRPARRRHDIPPDEPDDEDVRPKKPEINSGNKPKHLHPTTTTTTNSCPSRVKTSVYEEKKSVKEISGPQSNHPIQQDKPVTLKPGPKCFKERQLLPRCMDKQPQETPSAVEENTCLVSDPLKDDHVCGIFATYFLTNKLSHNWAEFYEDLVDTAYKYKNADLISLLDNKLHQVCTKDNCIDVLDVAKSYAMTTAIDNVTSFIDRVYEGKTIDEIKAILSTPIAVTESQRVFFFSQRIENDDEYYVDAEQMDLDQVKKMVGVQKIWTAPIRQTNGRFARKYLFSFTYQKFIKDAVRSLIKMIQYKSTHVFRKKGLCEFVKNYHVLGEYIRLDEVVYMDTLLCDCPWTAEQLRETMREMFKGVGARKSLASCIRLKDHFKILKAAFKCAKDKFARFPKTAPNNNMIKRVVYTNHRIKRAMQTIRKHPKRTQHTHVNLNDRERIPCSTCGRTYGSKDWLFRHIRIVHEGVKPFWCKICNRRFASKSNLGQHEKTHLDLKDRVYYPCQKCDKTFLSKSFMKNHMIGVHEGRKEYICKICDKQFAYKCNLREHEKTHTDRQIGGKYLCKKCDGSFVTKQMLKIHIKEFHDGNTRFTCKICYKRYLYMTNLLKHEVTHKDLKRE